MTEPRRPLPVFPSAAVLLLALGAAAPAWALYKVVGPDGKVTYTDRPPTDTQARTEAVSPAGSVVGGTVLPFAIRQVVQRFPVTLYTGNNCQPCDAGRAMLTDRGVPFIERTVNTPDDVQALRRAEQTDSLPLLRIGGQQISGFAASEWHSYLDAAGYPRQSVLPASFKQPPGTPLAPRGGAPAAAPSAPPAAAAPAQPPTPTPGSGPSNFRF
jgi:glutaredoxin